MSENICPNCGGPRGECRNLFCGPEFEEASLDRNRYQEHLRSDAWQRLFRLVLDRCRGKCEARLEGCTGEATQLYRRTSQHFGLEPLWNFSGVCDHCDQALREASGEYIDWGPCQAYDSTLMTIAALSEEVHHEN